MGSAAQRAAPPFGISMLRAAKPPFRRGFACGKTLVRSTRAAGQKAGGVQFCLLVRNFKISKLSGYDKTKGHPKGCPFVLGSDRQRRSPPFGISMLGVGKAAPAPRFSPAVKTLVRRTRAAGQKAGWVQFCPLAENLKIFRL